MICCHKSKYLVDGAWFANSYLLPHTAAVFTLLLFAASWFVINKFTFVDANCCIVYEFVLLPNAIQHILCEFEFNCGTRCGFLVGICTLMHKCKISRTLVYCLHIHVFWYTLMQGCVCFANLHLFANAGILFAKSSLYVAHWCIAWYFMSLPHVDSVLITNKYIRISTHQFTVNEFILVAAFCKPETNTAISLNN